MGTNKFYLFFVCFTWIVFQIADDVAVGKIWQDQIRHGLIDVTQSYNATDMWVVEGIGDLEILAKTLDG